MKSLSRNTLRTAEQRHPPEGVGTNTAPVFMDLSIVFTREIDSKSVMTLLHCHEPSIVVYQIRPCFRCEFGPINTVYFVQGPLPNVSIERQHIPPSSAALPVYDASGANFAFVWSARCNKTATCDFPVTSHFYPVTSTHLAHHSLLHARVHH